MTSLQRQRSGRSARPGGRGEGGREKVREKAAEKTGQEELSSDEVCVPVYMYVGMQYTVFDTCGLNEVCRRITSPID